MGKSTHVHFQGKILEVIPSFHNHPHSRDDGGDGTVVERGTHDHPGSHNEQRQSVEETIAPFVMIKHLALTTLLSMVERKQRIQLLRQPRVQT